MLVIDLVVGALIAVAAILGARAGFARALPIAGFAAGAVLGTRAPLLVGEELDSEFALVIAVPAALIAGGVVGALSESLSAAAAPLMRRSLVVDGAFGAVLAAAAAAVVVWALAPAVSEVGSVRHDVQRSEALERFNALLTPVGPVRRAEAPPLDPPQPGRRSPANKPVDAVGDPRLLRRPEVIRADRSLVKITVSRCGGGFQGTGWIAGHGMIVTNAHVVTASTRVTVRRQGDGPSLEAGVVWFDGIHDLALLRVGELRRAPGLAMAEDARPSTAAITLGFPGGKKTIRRARLQQTTTELKLDALELAEPAGISLTMEERLVTVIAGTSAPGGSGGPVIDREGRVVATVFSGIPKEGRQPAVILAVPNRIVRSALKRANHRVDVPGCDDPPLTPTARESIAARNA